MEKTVKTRKKPAVPEYENSKNVILTEDDLNNFSNNKNSLSKTVYERLISMFLNNELVPGQMLSRQQLADALGVSIAPVLEALIQLELDGFVESIPKKGTIVRPIKEKNIYERFILREALECAAARLYAGKPIQQNKKVFLDYALKIDKDDLYSLPRIKNDIIFHASLVNLAGLPNLTREFLKATRMGTFCIQNHVGFVKRMKVQNHIGLIEKLSTNNPDEAEKTIREHIWGGKPMPNKYHFGSDNGQPDVLFPVIKK